MGKDTIAAFDFDGTITTKDTLVDFLVFAFGWPKFLVGLIVKSPILINYKLGVTPNYRAKESLFAYFWNNTPMSNFNSITQKYATTRLPQILRQEALSKINWHKDQGHKIVILSASLKNWIEPWASSQNIKVIATEIEIQKNKLTGKFLTENCYGPEKIKRLLEFYPKRSNYILYAYGDSKGDKELLKFADLAFYKNFSEKL